MTLYRYGLRQARLAWLVWTLVVVLIVVMVVSTAAAVVQTPAVYTAVMRGMPASLLALFGGAALLRHPLDSYLVSKLLLYLPLIGGLLGAFQAASLARELETGQADFLLALPVRRAAVFGARLATTLSAVAGLWVVTGLTLLLATRSNHLPLALGPVALLAYAGFVVDAVLVSAALAAAVLAGSYRGGLRLALAIVVAPAIVDWALKIALVPPGWLLVAPYGYYDPARILVSHPFAWAATLVLIPATVVIGYLGQRVFERKEV